MSKGSSCNVGWTCESLGNAVRRCTVTKYLWSQLEGTLYDNFPKAAVLIPLFICNGEIHVWLTKRSDKVGKDKGHVSFPGGMKDPDDVNEIATCLRESNEEIGLEATQVEILGVLHPSFAVRQILVSPVVGLVSEDFKPRPNEEVAVAFHLPLDRFLRKERCDIKYMNVKGILLQTLHFKDEINGQVITTWGFTANICAQLAAAIFERESEYALALIGKIDPRNPFLFSKIAFKEMGNVFKACRL